MRGNKKSYRVTGFVLTVIMAVSLTAAGCSYEDSTVDSFVSKRRPKELDYWLLNNEELILLRPDESLTSVRAAQSENAPELMTFTVSGTDTALTGVSSNAFSPIDERPSLNVTAASFPQEQNASLPIVFTLAGSSMEVMPSQS